MLDTAGCYGGEVTVLEQGSLQNMQCLAPKGGGCSCCPARVTGKMTESNEKDSCSDGLLQGKPDLGGGRAGRL